MEPVRIHRIGAWTAALVATGAQQRRAGGGRRSSRILAAAFLLLAGKTGAAAEWNGYASIATDYIYRGISLLDSGPSVQVSMEGRFDQGFVVGAWAANVDRQWSYQYALSSHAELNLFAGVDFGCGSECRARVIVTSYQYPGSSASNWEEATASVSFAERVGASLSWSPRGLGINRSTRTLEGWYVQPLSRATSLEFDGGTLHIGSAEYWFARAGVSHRIDRWVIDLSHYWSDPKYRHFGLDDRSERFVLSASTAF